MRDIDIVVTYLDSNKKNWQEEYRRYQEEEIEKGIQREDNRQAFGEERIREWDTLRYWLRGVEKNLDFVRNVIIVVYDRKQVPEWLNLENKRLRVVEHKEYIEEELLPTFNAMEIGMYVSKIEGLSDRYIMSDDDFYFINKIEKEMFFRGNKTVQEENEVRYEKYGERYLKASDGVFYSILNNNLEIEEKYMGEKKVKYRMSHMPEARDKLIEQEIIKENYEIFKEAFKISKFRHKKHYSAQMYPNIMKIRKECVFSDSLKKDCKYVTLKSDVKFEEYKDFKIVCFNDTEQLDDFEVTKEKLIRFLDSKLPEKCSFER